ncbi:MAG: class I SAM-dependent methyltransferase, partial [Actinomycetota bacterium]|nr:class I SAM-dependent methyltransferase [Actinomycetota bacterium]
MTSSLYRHPLAYLVGLQGVTLMKAFAGDYGRDVTVARLAETKHLMDTAHTWGDGVELPRLETADGYDGWAPRYDDPQNGYFAMDEAQLLPLLDHLPVGVAVDAACGTGRYAAHLTDRGHVVHGFDTSRGMLALARAKVPSAHFALADMTDLPLPDSSVDAVVNTLAMTHLA